MPQAGPGETFQDCGMHRQPEPRLTWVGGARGTLMAILVHVKKAFIFYLVVAETIRKSECRQRLEFEHSALDSVLSWGSPPPSPISFSHDGQYSNCPKESIAGQSVALFPPLALASGVFRFSTAKPHSLLQAEPSRRTLVWASRRPSPPHGAPGLSPAGGWHLAAILSCHQDPQKEK